MRLIVKVAIAGVVSYAAYRAAKLIAPDGLDTFVKNVREGMSEREAQLREALGLEVDTGEPERPARHGANGNAANGSGTSARNGISGDGANGMSTSQARALLDDPAGPGPTPRAPQG